MPSIPTRTKLWKRVYALRAIAWMLFIAIGINTGCVSNKKLVLAQDKGQKLNRPVQYTGDRAQYKLQTGDVLSVNVKGVEQDLQNTFNLASGGIGGMVAGDPGTQYINGYSVDENGDIMLTSVGKVRVKGLTLAEATDLCQKRISNFLKEATVSVKLVSFKITVLGEVKRAGVLYVQNTRCNVLEAIGYGGDMTAIANRQRVKLLRQTAQGTEVVLLDLTSTALLSSPYYNLQPNDVLYIEPLAGQTPRKNFTPVNLGLGIVSVLATVALVIFTIGNNQ